MFLPPEPNTKERRSFDLCDLRVYHLICEELGIANEENVRKSFYHLMRWAGRSKFHEEVIILRDYIAKIKKERKRGIGEDECKEYFKGDVIH